MRAVVARYRPLSHAAKRQPRKMPTSPHSASRASRYLPVTQNSCIVLKGGSPVLLEALALVGEAQIVQVPGGLV